jgi:hypothetical protein
MFGLVPKDQRSSNAATNSSVVATTVTAGVSTLELVNYSLPGGVRVISKTIYAPTEFATYATAEVLFFNNAPHLPNNDVSKFLLPAGAKVIGALLTNNGTPIVIAPGPTDVIGIGILTNASPIFDSAILSQANTPGGLSVGINTAGLTGLAALGSDGAFITGLTSLTPTAEPIGMLILDVVSGGDLAMIITYIL